MTYEGLEVGDLIKITIKVDSGNPFTRKGIVKRAPENGCLVLIQKKQEFAVWHGYLCKIEVIERFKEIIGGDY